MNQTETAIYRKYRHHLRNQSSAGSVDNHTRSPERRQNARAAVVAQFGIPFAEVKRIVALGDAEHKVTHERPQAPTYTPRTPVRPRTRPVPFHELHVGNRIIMRFSGMDARIIALTPDSITFRGIEHDRSSQTSHEWTHTGFDTSLPWPVVLEPVRA